LSRAQYAATGGAIGGAVGGLVSRKAASTCAGIGAFVGAVVGEKWFDAEPMVTNATETAKEKAADRWRS